MKPPNKYLQNQISPSRTPPNEDLKFQEIKKSIIFYNKLKYLTPNIKLPNFAQNDSRDSSIIPLKRPKEGGTCGKVIILLYINILMMNQNKISISYNH